jgi:hypothetical protein
MTANNAQENKEKEILEGLFLKEEDTLKELKSLVDMSKSCFKVEQETSNVVLNRNVSWSNKDKVVLLLIGKYFANRMTIVESPGIDIAGTSAQLGIPKTTLSGPLGDLIKNGTIQKNDSGEYSIKYHQMRGELERLSSKANAKQ